MGVDLATYRARIGTFVRDVSCGDEKHRSVSAKRKWKDGKGVCKVVFDRGSCLQNFKYVIFRIFLCFVKRLDVQICADVEFGNKPHGPNEQKYTYEPHHCAGHMSGAAGKVAHLLTLMVTSLIWLRQLLILSGDVEVNPGPLGQHGEESFREKISSILDNYKDINFKQLRIIKLIFYGTPRTGKTTLRKQLLGEPVQKSTCQPSTEIVKICDPVFVERIVMTNKENNEWRWTVQKLDDIAKTLLQCLNNEQNVSHLENKIVTCEEKPNVSAAPSTTPAPHTTMNHQHAQIEQMAITSDLLKPPSQITTEVEEDTAPMTVPDEVNNSSTDVDIKQLFFQAIKTGQWAEVVGEAMLLQVIDGGGQPSFQEIFPLLISGPSVTLLMFKLTDDLRKSYAVQYQPNIGAEHTWQDTYVVRDFIFHAISSTVSFRDNTNNRSGCKILLVGTHKDELKGSEEQRKAKIMEINRSLHGWLRELKTFKCIQVKNVENFVVGIDNFKQQDILEVKKQVEELVKQTPPKDIPAPWLVFDFVLHTYAKSQQLRKVGKIKCEEISQQCGVKDEEFEVVLHYLHYEAGTLLYYPDIPQLNNCVITDFQLIFDSISKIIVGYFDDNSERGPHLSDKYSLHEKGQLNTSILKDVEGCLEKNELLALMQHRHIISKMDGDTFFMPSVLPKAEPSYSKSSDSSSFLVMFEHGCCPIGLFCAVTTRLIVTYNWRLQKNAPQFRNKISFYLSKKVYCIIFTAFFAHYEISLVGTKDKSSNKQIFKAVDEAFRTVCKDMNYPSPSYGFYCPKDCTYGGVTHVQNEHPAKCTTFNKEVKEMICYYSDEPSNLTKEHKSWLHQVQPQEQINEMPEMETKKLYDEAIEKGYVEYCTITCLIHGSAGVGKTHVKQLLLNKSPPIQRTSTGLAENAVRAVTVSAVGVSNKDEDEWRILDGDDDLMRAISKMISGYVEPIPKPDHHSKQPSMQMSSPVSGGRSAGLSSDVSISKTVTSLPTKKAPDKDEVQPSINIITDGELGQSPSELDQTDADITESHMSVEERIIGLIKKHSGDKEHLKMKWIQLIDSGGQPQFHHLLPLFVHNLSVVMFVLKLSEVLDHNPQVLYFENDEVLGKAYRSPFSHKEVFERCLKAVHSSTTRPDVIVVGTHKDLKQLCNESMEVKNESILTCLNTNNILPNYTGQTMKEVIFAVNSKAPQAEDRDHAKYLRQKISKLTSEVKKMPIAWFCLELSLRVLTKKKRREVLSLSECKQTAGCFQINNNIFHAALKYFVDCNILLYYREVLPNIVFCNPQVLLSIITELVQYCYRLRESPDPNKPISGEWQCFKDYAYITEKQLDSFPGHYHKDVFSSSDLLELFKSHSIVAPMGNGEYLMPALLPALPHGNMSSVQLSGDPLLIRFKKGYFPSGVFCSLVAHLLNDASFKLSLCIKDNKPKCLYSNSITFSCDNYPATCTIFDDNSYFAIYIHSELNCKPHSPIRTRVHRGIISAFERLGYQCKQEDIMDAVYCNHDKCKGEEKHLAYISATKTDSWTTCSHDGDRKKRLLESQKLWFSAEHSTNAPPYPATSGHTSNASLNCNPDNQDSPAAKRSRLEEVSTSRVPSSCSLPLLELVDQAAQTLGEPPTLPSLISIKPDLAVQVGANYSKFGILLLEDATGARVEALEVEHNRSAERINFAILKQWIQGKGRRPVSWQTLINVLHSIEK